MTYEIAITAPNGDLRTRFSLSPDTNMTNAFWHALDDMETGETLTMYRNGIAISRCVKTL